MFMVIKPNVWLINKIIPRKIIIINMTILSYDFDLFTDIIPQSIFLKF